MPGSEHYGRIETLLPAPPDKSVLITMEDVVLTAW